MKYLAPWTLLLAALLATPAQAGDRPPEFLSNGGAFPLSEAVQVDDILYLSGQLGIDDSGRKLVAGGIVQETKRTMDRIGTTLAKYELDHDALFKCTVMLAEIADFGAFNTVYKSYFKPGRYPSRSAFQTAGLVLDARVEVECWAWNPQKKEAPAPEPKDSAVSIRIEGFECGDNCYLDYRLIAADGMPTGESKSALCSIDICADWFSEQAMPAAFAGRSATAIIGVGKQHDNAGNVMNDDFPEVTSITVGPAE
ncbi:MAG: RidA family protein [Parasphingorhabdus sp.]